MSNTAFIETTARVLNLQEAARYLRLSEPAFRDLLKKGEIPYRKAGRVYRFSTKALDAWLEGGTPEAAK